MSIRRSHDPQLIEALVASESLEPASDVDEPDARHEILAGAGAQNILDYYTRLGGTGLSQIVIVIDEFSNLLGGDKATGSKLEDTIQLYAEIMRWKKEGDGKRAHYVPTSLPREDQELLKTLSHDQAVFGEGNADWHAQNHRGQLPGNGWCSPTGTRWRAPLPR